MLPIVMYLNRIVNKPRPLEMVGVLCIKWTSAVDWKSKHHNVLRSTRNPNKYKYMVLYSFLSDLGMLLFEME